MTENVVYPTMIERVAMAIWEANAPKSAPPWEGLDFMDQMQVKDIARIVIREMMIPTDEMVSAGSDGANLGETTGVWQAMINAALKEG